MDTTKVPISDLSPQCQVLFKRLLGLRAALRELVRDIPGCAGCPMFQTGTQPFVPDELVENAPVLLMFQNPGEVEEQQGRPTAGKTGELMERHFFPLLGVQRGEVSIGNALRCRLKGGNTLPPVESPMVRAAIDHCTRAHHRLPTGTTAILASGEYAAYAIAGVTGGFSGWRGYVRPYTAGEEAGPPTYFSVWTPPTKPRNTYEIPVLITYHLAYAFRDPSAVVPLKADWQKLSKVATREWPLPFPRVDTDPPKEWPSVAAFDTEFHGAFQTPTLVRYSLATPERRVWVVEASDVGQGQLPVTPGSTVVLHNAPVDIPHLGRIIPLDGVRLDDTMFAHAVLWGGREPKEDNRQSRGGVAFQHNLNYLGSMYGRTNRHKHLVHVNPTQYAGGDALHTMDAWEGMRGEFARDPQSWRVYEEFQRPLLSIILRARERGLRVNQGRVRTALQELEAGQQDAVERAQASVGWPINVGSSKQVGEWLYGVEHVK